VAPKTLKQQLLYVVIIPTFRVTRWVREKIAQKIAQKIAKKLPKIEPNPLFVKINIHTPVTM
jgi:hypothetical protein